MSGDDLDRNGRGESAASDDAALFARLRSLWRDVDPMPATLIDRMIDLFPRFGGVILDARLFGQVLNAEEERQALVARIQSRGLTATPLAETNRLGAYYFHFHAQPGA